MATYDLEELIHLWENERITIEQALGQILLHLQALLERLEALEQQRG